MKIKYYGTAAAEGFPAIFCACDACEKAAQLGGRNIRTRSQALIDGKLLIDFPPDTYLHVLNYGLDLTTITTCLITHNHSDHLCAAELEKRRPAFAHTRNNEAHLPFDIYISEKSSREFEGHPQNTAVEDGTLRLFTVKAFSPFEAEGYIITPLKAAHDPRVEPLIYMISKSGKTMLYGHDTGYFPEETWKYLEKNKPYFHFISLDCTGIIREKYREHHMSLEANVEVRDRLIEIGCADENTIFCVHHFSHNGGVVYDDFVPLAKEQGFMVSYDTMEVEF